MDSNVTKYLWVYGKRDTQNICFAEPVGEIGLHGETREKEKIPINWTYRIRGCCDWAILLSLKFVQS